ncbi:MAG: tetratricopeptide repeat protein, partial [Pseudomonadales bacterium]|nr:tetratricopeptide repeat protein [Pseudomonadales bacterium]
TEDRLWSQGYKGELGDLFAIQERIAQEVVASLDVAHPAESGDRLTPGPMGDVAAWQCLVQARQAGLRWRKDGIDEAVELLTRGLSVVGDDARLHAALGRTHLHYREIGVDTSDTPLKAAESCAARASALEPGLAVVHQLEGWIRYSRSDIRGAVDALELARAQEPNDPDTLGLLANCLLISGQVEAARPLIETLVSIDPLTPLTRCMPGWADAMEGNFEAALGPYRDMFTMDEGNPMARLFYVYMLAASGRRDEAHDVAEALPEYLRSSPPGRIIGIFAKALAGERPDPLPPAEGEALARGTDVIPRFLAQAYALGGDEEQAVTWAARAVDRGFISHAFLANHDPFLAPLVGHAGYDQVLETARARLREFVANE